MFVYKLYLNKKKGINFLLVLNKNYSFFKYLPSLLIIDNKD